MSIESTRETITKYLNAAHGGVSMLTPDVVFTIMGSGQESRGPEAVLGMMRYMYRVAFEATAIPRTLLFGDNSAMLECDFAGKHIGEFNGIPPTGKEVKVPMVVVYDLENDLIKAARVYIEMGILLQQLGIPAAATA
jgi:predicted ester cyclase